ncbi:phospholipase A1 VesT1.02-like [Bacillus rossius redtenbacheri]|uniref:phospholipase A1 VesT1.02-like n=1 Tax=Bacillus rossius redtenbacheri TaxID=93214 RepID=UPI002FDE34B5
MKSVLLVAACSLVALATGKEIDFDDDDITDDMFDIDDENDIDIEKQTRRYGLITPEDVNFTIYSRDNCTAPVFLNDTPAQCFDPLRPTKILIHGFLAKGKTFNKMKDAYLRTGDYNVIVADWSQVASCWHSSKLSALVKMCYIAIVKSHLEGVSGLVASLIGKLARVGQDAQNMHLVGHSLGAHVAGQASQRAGVDRYLGRITGLDPASPLLKSKNLTKVLDEKDAEFVDVIHTNVNYLGWKKPLGTADFYPYDGKGQPGCSFPSNVFQKCSHSKSHKYFTQTILDAWAFVAVPCGVLREYDREKCHGTDVIYMGENVPLSARGSYYVTAAFSPCLKSSLVVVSAGLVSLSLMML